VIDAIVGIVLVLVCLWVVRSRALRRMAAPVLPVQRRPGGEPVPDRSGVADRCAQPR
jgi:hypothetical protein